MCGGENEEDGVMEVISLSGEVPANRIMHPYPMTVVECTYSTYASL